MKARVSLPIAAFAGLLLTLAFPPLSLWPLSWLALAPLYVVIGSWGVRPLAAFRDAWVFGVVVFLVGAYWMLALGSPTSQLSPVGIIPWAALAFIEAIPFGIQAVFCSLLGPRLPRAARPVLFAAIWVGGEWMRGWGRVAFPWFLLAAAQVRAPLPLLQILTVTGQWGLSFAVALAGALLGEAYLCGRNSGENSGLSKRERAHAALLRNNLVGAAIAIPLLLHVGGVVPYALTLADSERALDQSQTMTIAAIQGNITKEAIENGTSQEFRRSTMATYGDMTREAAKGIERPDLIAWPETVAPGTVLREQDLYDQTTEIARDSRTSLLIGTLDLDDRDRMLNTAVLFDASGTMLDRYDKQQIVPIGEYFPLRDLLGPIYQQFGVPKHDMQAGNNSGLMTVSVNRPGIVVDGPHGSLTPPVYAHVGAMICYDDVFPQQARNRVRLGADVLTLITSDETFGLTAGPQQHADLDVLRAVESRRYLMRVAATGPSEAVAPTGVIESLLPLDRKGILQRRVPLLRGETLFVRWGDWFAWASVGLALALGVWALTRQIPAPAALRGANGADSANAVLNPASEESSLP